MSKKKSKGPKIDPKAALAQQQNDYIKRLSAFCRAFIDEDIIRLIPRTELNILFDTRIRSLAIKPAPGHLIPDLVVKATKTIVISHLKETTLSIENSDKTVTLYDACTLGLQLYHYQSFDEKPRFKDSARIYALLKWAFGDLREMLEPIYMALRDETFMYTQLLINNFNDGYYTFQLGRPETYKNDGVSTIWNIDIRQYPAETDMFTIHKQCRPAYRVGWASPDDLFSWIALTPAKLGMSTAFKDLQIPIYVQSHAFRRLSERLDCLDESSIKQGILISFLECKAIADGNEFMIEFKVHDVKVGYLKATLIDGKLLIRTFLFLTCKDTPEGKRLETHLGLTKFDTIYLKMDRLSTFMTDHLHHNTKLRNLFIKADCRDLVNLHDQLDRFSNVHPLNSPLEKLIGYLTANDIQLPNWEAIAVDER